MRVVTAVTELFSFVDIAEKDAGAEPILLFSHRGKWLIVMQTQ
jgi:hypothetical protein